MMRNEGYEVNHKRVYRIWREEGLKRPKEQPKRPQKKNHVWSYDFVSDQTYNGKKFRVLNIIDEYTRECVACHVGAQHHR